MGEGICGLLICFVVFTMGHWYETFSEAMDRGEEQIQCFKDTQDRWKCTNLHELEIDK